MFRLQGAQAQGGGGAGRVTLSIATGMSARDFDLPAELEALLQKVCSERGIPSRLHDELRLLLAQPPETWPTCCKASCAPCVDDQARIAREVLSRWGRHH